MQIIKYCICVGACLLLWCNITLSQNLPDSTDTLNTTTDTNLSDTTNQTPPPVIHSSNSNQGSILVDCDTINFSKISTINYFVLTEILTNEFATTPLFTTLLGNHTDFAWMGTFNNNALMLNGVNMNDFCGLNNYDAVSPEFANKLEILSGSQAAIVAGVAGLAVNVQPTIFDTKKPYTRIWYTQGDNKLIGIDGIYSQNFLPNWNITAGFKRLSSNSFYQNSFFDVWNARAILSHRLSNLSSLTFIYHFSNYNTGDFGGINFEDYNTNDNSVNQVRSNFSNLQDRQYKTDCILTHTTTSADSNFTINSNMFWGYTENHIFFNEESGMLTLDSTGRNIGSATNYGFNTTAKYMFSTISSVDFGGEIAYNNVPTSLLTRKFSGIGYNLFGNAKMKLSTTSLSFGGRFGQKYGKNIHATGANIDKKLSTKLNLFADISYLNATPQSILDFKNETHLLAILGSKYQSTTSNVTLNLFYRNISNPILLAFDKEKIYTFTPEFVNIDKQEIIGLSGNVAIKLPFSFETKLLVSDYLELSSNNSDEKYTNNFYLSWLLQYTYTKATSSVTFGAKVAISLNTHKLYYNPLFRHYAVSDLSDNFEYDGVTAYIIAKLGNCHLRASFKNMLGTNFSYLAYYPTLKQEFCLSLTWAFPM